LGQHRIASRLGLAGQSAGGGAHNGRMGLRLKTFDQE
jgi:hypothetical protein